MGIETTHPSYDAHIDVWNRCRHSYEGEDAIKGAGQAYLPRIGPSQTAEEYAGYLKRAMYFEAVGRTVDGFTGAIARKDPVLTLPAKIAEFVDDVTGDGVGLAEFIKKLCAETLLTARAGLLVDFDEEKNRSVLTLYTAESITNWGEFGIVLREQSFEADPEDRFKLRSITQYRQLSLEDGVYTVTVWRKPQTVIPGARSEFAVYDVKRPSVRGLAIGVLPFFWVSTMGMTEAIEKPPLLGLVNVALSHYRSSADLEHGRHYTGMPTLYITGVRDDDPIHVGAMAAITVSDANSKVGYAEFTGQGLGSLENALAEKAHMMAALGASLISAPKKGIEAAETARIRTSGENSLLMGVVSAVEEALEAALTCAAGWMGAAGNVQVEINRDFAEVPMDGPMLVGLVQAYQAGALSLPQFLFNLQQSAMLDPSTTIDDEVAALRAAGAPKPGEAERIAADAAQNKAAGRVPAANKKPVGTAG